MKNNLKIAVAGNQWITEYLIQNLIDANYKPDLIINCGSEKSANISGYTDLQNLAEKNEIEIYRPDKYTLKSEIDQANLLAKQIDILVVFGWQRLIPEWLIEHCGKGVFGVHGGPEKPPRARGRAVFNWALLLGYKKFYMYLFKITPEVDSGKIIELTEFDILPEDDITSLYHKNCIVSTRMIIQNLTTIIEDKLVLMEQPEEEATYLPKRIPENGGIYWDWSAERINNLIRAVAPPYPGAFTFMEAKKVNIFRAQVFDKKINFSGCPGEILDVFPNGDFIVMTKDFPLYVREYQSDLKENICKGKTFQLHSGEQPEDPKI